MSPPPNVPPTPADAMVERWCRADGARAFVKSDHDVIESTTAVRSVIAERLTSASGTGMERDVLNAFGALGRLVGERGGSPTLAAAIVDGALEALGSDEATPSPRQAAWVIPARAAMAEAFARARNDAAKSEANARWEYPACAVSIAPDTVAVAAGFPDDDVDALREWASRVAHGASLSSVRRVIVSGSAAAEAALAEALGIAGIECIPGQAPPARPAVTRR
jgi:hypothetical protein